MHHIFNPADGHMAFLSGVGLAMMGLSIPGRKLAKLSPDPPKRWVSELV